MAWESSSAFITILPSTGLRQFRFVTINTSGKLQYPSVSPATGGGPIVGVLVSNGTTGSTVDPVKGATVQIRGVAKVEAVGSTAAVGDFISASSKGKVDVLDTADYKVGVIVAGSSGSSGRIVSVLLSPAGTVA